MVKATKGSRVFRAGERETNRENEATLEKGRDRSKRSQGDRVTSATGVNPNANSSKTAGKEGGEEASLIEFCLDGNRFHVDRQEGRAQKKG